MSWSLCWFKTLHRLSELDVVCNVTSRQPYVGVDFVDNFSRGIESREVAQFYIVQGMRHQRGLVQK